MVIQLDEVRKARKREQDKARYQANKEKVKARYQANREEILDRNRKWREANKEGIAERARAHYQANKERYAERRRAYYQSNKERYAERRRAYYQSNKEEMIKRSREWANNKYAIDDAYRLTLIARRRIKTALSAKSPKNSTRAIKFLGCSREVYREWIESQFTEGMSWANEGEWHVDHTFPVMPAIRQFGEAALPVVLNYRNCKPMWAEENLSKSATIPPDDEIHPWVRERLASLENFG